MPKQQHLQKHVESPEKQSVCMVTRGEGSGVSKNLAGLEMDKLEFLKICYLLK